MSLEEKNWTLWREAFFFSILAITSVILCCLGIEVMPYHRTKCRMKAPGGRQESSPILEENTTSSSSYYDEYCENEI